MLKFRQSTHLVWMPPLGKLTGLRNNIMQVEGNESVAMEDDPSIVTIIILRPAETIGTKSSLSPQGQMRADFLSKIFAISWIFKDD